MIIDLTVSLSPILFVFINYTDRPPDITTGCSDINECSANSTYTGDYCTDIQTSCTNTVGSWTCTCATGQ